MKAIRLEVLTQAKAQKVEEIIRHSTPDKAVSEDVRNATVLLLVRELRTIQTEIDGLQE